MTEGNEGNEPPFEFVIRPGEPGDLDFIVDSWRRSYDDAPNTRCPGGLPEYIATQRQVIEQCLRTSQVLVACPEDDRWQVLGWVCFRKVASLTVLHYVYVKPLYRNKAERLGTRLLMAALEPAPGVRVNAVFHTHQIPYARTPDHPDYGASMAVGSWCTRWRSGGVRLSFNPALIFAPKETE